MQRLSGRRITNAAANSYLAASNLLNLANEREEGSFYWSMASAVFSAFTYEAFLNSIGEEVLGSDQWLAINKAGWRRKHSVILTTLSLPTDFSCRPELTLIELFEFRNRMAHGREEELDINGTILADIRPLTLQEATITEWEKKCTVEYATRALNDVKLLAINILMAMGRQIHGSNPFGSPSHGGYSVEDAS